MGGLDLYQIRRRGSSPELDYHVSFRLLQNMRVYFIYLLFIFIKENFGADECSTELSTEGRLRKTLFCNYDKMARPVKYFENQTLVQFQLYPTKIYMEEHEEVIAFQGSILYVWSDVYLKWDPREYEGLDFIRVKSSEIWVPDITVDTGSHSTSSLSVASGGDCHLAHMGYVYCFIMTTLQAPCTPDITNYPFDIQNCTLTFSSSGFVGKYINFTLFDPKNGIKMTLYKPNKFWELKEATARRQVKYLSIEDKSTFYPLIRCNFILKRHSAGLSAILILPAAVLAGLSLLIFWMDSMYPTRIGIAAIVILSDVIYSIYLGVILPSNGDRVPIIVTFFRDSLIIASFSVIITIVVRSVRMRTRSPSRWVTDMLGKMESISVVQFVFLGEGSPKEEDAVEIIEGSKKSSTPWDQLATFIDRVSFILCCFTYAVLLMFYLP